MKITTSINTRKYYENYNIVHLKVWSFCFIEGLNGNVLCYFLVQIKNI